MLTSRIGRQQMFLEMAQVASQRSTCTRMKVGCVITDLEMYSVCAIGYNGNAKGLPNTCDLAAPGGCGCIHAEMNALLKAPFNSGPLLLFTTHSPCHQCAKLILNSRVIGVFYGELYRSHEGINILDRRGVTCLPVQYNHDVQTQYELELETYKHLSQP